MNKKPKIGDILYSLNINNAARHTTQVLTPVKVISVGRKYFTCAKLGEENKTYFHAKYHLDNWFEKTNYSANSKLYESKQSFEDEKESNIICWLIYESFYCGHNKKRLSLDQLRIIEKMLGEKQ